jgi:hypothetical protein
MYPAGTTNPATGKPYYLIVNRASQLVLENTPAREKTGVMVGGKLIYKGDTNVSGNWTWQRRSSGSTQQQYEIVDVSENPSRVDNKGVYKITNLNSNKVLTAAENRSVSGQTLVFQKPDWGLASQQWTFSNVDYYGWLDPYSFYISNRNTKQVLTTFGTYSGAPADMRDKNTEIREQIWSIKDPATGNSLTMEEFRDGRPCYLYNMRSFEVLEMGGSTSEQLSEDRGANIWEAWGGRHQKWIISYVSANRPAGTVTSNTAAQAAEPQFTVYPNPARDALTVSVAGSTKLTSVKVTDMRGATTAARYQGNGRVDVAGLASGIYIVTASDGQREYRQKFVKQ